MTAISSLPNDAPTIQSPPLPGVRRMLAAIGRAARRSIEGVGRNASFVGATFRAFGDIRGWTTLATTQMRRLGVDSLGIGVFIAAFTGVVLALLASYSFSGAVPLYFVGTLVEKTITLELAPVLTGLALAGRVGANIAAELGTMRVTEQIDALESLAYDPFSYLVAPRVLAGATMFPIVVSASMITGVASGWAASITLLDLSSADFLKGLRLFFTAFDVRYGLVKSASFGTAVTLIGCACGMRARGGAEGVGRAATNAVVYSAVAILVLDAFWAVTWLLGARR